MLKIYHIELRRSERVVWLMEELKLPYDLIFTRGDIMGSAMAIKAVHAIGAAPTVQDGDLWLCESGAILEYVISRYGGGRLGVSPEKPEYPSYLQWMHFAEGTAMDRILGEIALKPLLALTPPGTSMLSGLYVGGAQRMLSFFEQSLQDRPYFAGDEFTAADIMMHLPTKAAARHRAPDAYPTLQAWLERVEARPAYKRMLARALPDGTPPFPGGGQTKPEQSSSET